MGRPRVKIMDDSEKESEVKKKVQKNSEKPDKSESQQVGESADQKSESTDKTDTLTNRPSDILSTSESSEKTPTPRKPQKPGKAKPRSKKYQEAVKDLDRNKSYPLNEALDMVKKVSYSRFASTLEAHINTSQTGIRGLISLPYATGRKLRILVFGKGAESSEADTVGTDETIEDINKGSVEFDLVITTPEWMPKLAKIARILGPRGLMPNPKNGTITDDLKKAVEGFQTGKTEYKTEAKAPVIHLTLGKLSQPNSELQANIKTLIQTLGKTRVKKVTLAPTMGPGIKIDLSSIG